MMEDNLETLSADDKEMYNILNGNKNIIIINNNILLHNIN